MFVFLTLSGFKTLKGLILREKYSFAVDVPFYALVDFMIIKLI